MSAWKLFYDGGCNLCHTSQLRPQRWAKAAHQPLEVALLQSDEAIAKGYGEAMVLEADGKVYKASAAWLRIMRIAPWYLHWLAVLDATPPTRWIAQRLYAFVARVRYRIWGRRTCPVPSFKQPKR